MKLSMNSFARLKKIKMLVMDIDGVMTDGRIIYTSEGQWSRFYSVRDGAGIVLLMQKGYKTGIITGAQSMDVVKRAEHLKIQYVHTGKVDKGPAYDEIKKATGYTDEEICYIGDDVFDVPLLKQVGFAATVPGALDVAKEVSHYITEQTEGMGAIRELCELIMTHGFYTHQGD